MTWLGALAVVVACAPTSNQPLVLIDGLKAGMTAKEAAAALGVSEGGFKTIYSGATPANSRAEGFSELVVRLKRTCLSTPAELQLTFYREQLAIVACYPDDWQSLIAATASAGIGEIRSRDSASARQGRVAYASKDWEDRRYVAFASQRLADAAQTWAYQHD